MEREGQKRWSRGESQAANPRRGFARPPTESDARGSWQTPARQRRVEDSHPAAIRLLDAIGSRGPQLRPPRSTAGCGKPHVRWCGRVLGRNPHTRPDRPSPKRESWRNLVGSAVAHASSVPCRQSWRHGFECGPTVAPGRCWRESRHGDQRTPAPQDIRIHSSTMIFGKGIRESLLN